ncbi:single-stranded DNA-binding protein [Echinicola vietnamensis]|uniref:Single-stranded DNA-binding protein n=1 Tax=Echinicola vietnamensis (strain DSM 17526 / LMG 23754 / KMM 6221) TaxID=926556 RepID=L0FWX8_ECHVK|nr:single-stranded DNA-binding protein [Echinicola vietnamensis]AGA77518.1 single stranded DNA-binding protein [Echinicola vietnamensis DSM 17526]
MAGVNKVILVGNLGRDPEVRHLESGSVVANVTLATTEAYKDRNGNRVENTEWHDLEMWDGQAKVAEQYLRKGSQIFVEGKIKSDTWQDEQGNNRKKVRIRVLSFTMLGSRNMDGGAPGGNSSNAGQADQSTPNKAQPAASMPSSGGNIDDGEDDLPF